LVPRFKSSTYNSMPPVYDPQRLLDQTGSPAQRGNLGSAAILSQNPIFEMAFKVI